MLLPSVNLPLSLFTPGGFAVLASGGRWKMARHLQLIDRKLFDIARGKLKRLIVEVPPRHGKSELIGRYFPAWYLCMFPDRHVMYASYEARQARKYGRLARNEFTAWAAQIAGLQVAADSAAADIWSIAGHEGGMVAVGAGGPLTGKGAHVLIVDDPTKNSDQSDSDTMREKLWDWWESTALTRLEPGGAVIVVQTRWHLDDLAGRAQARQAAEGWETIRLPALAEPNDPLGRAEGEPLWPERFDAAALAKIRDNKTLYWWLAMYQQQPSQHKLAEWPDEYFSDPEFWFDEWPEMALRVAALDPSQGRGQTGDFSAFTLVGEDPAGHLWVDANLARRPAGQIVEDAVELCRDFRPVYFGVESNCWQNLLGALLDPALLAAGLFDVEPLLLYNLADKHMRIRRLDRWLRARRMHFRKTPGARLLVTQLREFPLTRHDDGPDALEMATQLLARLKGDNVRESGLRVERIRAA